MSEELQSCHFIGIGGIGMSGLAHLLLQRGCQVSGSDLKESVLTKRLQEKGASVYIGQKKEQVVSGKTVVFSSGIKEKNPEFMAAQEKCCRLLHRSELLAQLMQKKRALCVAGTHGKTTTSSLLTWVLLTADVDLSFAVGGVLKELELNARWGRGEYFVAEADESDGTHLNYSPFAALITNIGLDHLDHYGNEEELIRSFRQFAEQVERDLFWCGDDCRLSSMDLPGISYGLSEECQLRGQNVVQKGWMLSFDLQFEGRLFQDIEVALVGQHNVLNALAVFGLAYRLGVSEEVIRRAFRTFAGVKRRQEKKGEVSGVLVIDDYAHHPTEIATTLKGLKEAVGERRVIALFQPHRYSRIRDCLGQFRGVFEAADVLWITEIFAAGQSPIEGVTHEKVVEETKGLFVSRDQVVEKLQNFVKPHDVVVTFGAGDVTAVGDQLLKALKQSPVKLKVGVVRGGRSPEHPVSLQSAAYVLDHLNSSLYDITCFTIGLDGHWSIGDKRIEGPVLTEEVVQALQECDLFFPMLHGPLGEDGTLQGFFEILGKPYVGSSCLASAVAMDKAMTKKVAAYHGVAVAPFLDFSLQQWQDEPEKILKEVRGALIFPLYVKPVRCGSSFGISYVEDEEFLKQGFVAAFQHDQRVIVEQAIMGREIEFAVLGGKVFAPGEVWPRGAVHSYGEKYGIEKVDSKVEAELSDSVRKKGLEIALKVWRALGLSGMARLDFFFDEGGTFWLNEVNPLPGMTPFSLYPRMTEHAGVDGNMLMDQLVINALKKT